MSKIVQNIDYEYHYFIAKSHSPFFRTLASPNFMGIFEDK